MPFISFGGLSSYFSGKTNRLGGTISPDEENLDIAVLTVDLVNMLRVIFKDVEAAPSFLVSNFILEEE